MDYISLPRSDIGGRQPRVTGGRLCAALLGLALGLPGASWATSVVQVETSLSLAPESAEMLVARASGTLPGGAGLRPGDVLHVLLTSTSVPNEALQGAGGYATLYVPAGFEVVDAALVGDQPEAVFESRPPRRPGLMPDGWGPKNESISPPGRLSQLYADTGIFYSTDPATAWFGPALPGQEAKAAGEVMPLVGASDAWVYNQWDYSMVEAHNGDLPDADGDGHTAFGYGSVVAGPHTYYQNDYRICGGVYCANGDPAAVGPWQRLQYGGSRVGYGPPAVDEGELRRSDTPTAEGTPVGLAAPLPDTVNAVRFSLGERRLGSPETTRLSLRLTDAGGLDANGCFVLHADVLGGDASGEQTGSDHPWRYAVPATVSLNSCLHLSQDGPAVAEVGDEVTYTLDWANLGAVTLRDVTLTNTLDEDNMLFVSSMPPPTDEALPELTWSLGDLTPGASGRVELTLLVDDDRHDLSANLASISSTEYGSGLESQGVTLLRRTPHIVFGTSVSPTAAEPGDLLTYTLTLENTGEGPTDFEKAIEVDRWLPEYLTIIEGSSVVSTGPACPFTDTADPTLPPLQLTPWQWRPQPPEGICAGDTLTLSFDVLLGEAPRGAHTHEVWFRTEDPLRETEATFASAPFLTGEPSFHELELSASDQDGAPLEPGDTLCYELEVYNSSALEDATRVTAIVSVPPHAALELASVAGAGADVSYSASGSLGPWSYVPAAPYDAAVTHVRLSWPIVMARETRLPHWCLLLDSPLPDAAELFAQATLTCHQLLGTTFLSDDPATPLPDDPTSVYVRARAALDTSTKEVSPAIASPGDTVSYTLHVRESGSNLFGASNVVVTDTIDTARLENINLGSLPPGVHAHFVSPVITWHLPGLAQGETVVLGFTADIVETLPPGTTVISNSASLVGDQLPIPVVTPSAAVELAGGDLSTSSKEVVPMEAAPGASVRFTVHLVESGGGAARNVQVTDVVDISKLENVVLDSLPPGVTGDYTPPVVVWSIASLTRGTSLDLSFTADIRPGVSGAVSNVAQVEWDDMAAAHTTPPAVVEVSDNPMQVVQLLKGVKSGQDAHWSWEPDAAAISGYRVYSVGDRAHLPPLPTTPRSLACESTETATTDCSSLMTPGLAYTRVVGVQDGREGPF